jgi:hypothetical protein
MAEIVTQQNMRQDVNPKDQFGRLWLAAIEKKTGRPCGGIDSAGWVDPLRTPQKYLKLKKNEFGQYDMFRLEVQTAQWIRDQQAAEIEWRRTLLQIAQEKMPGGGWTPDTIETHEWIVMLTGPKPWPSAAALRAAFLEFDPALLGLEPLTPEARALLGQDTLEDIEAKVNASIRDEAQQLLPAPAGIASWPEFVKWQAAHNQLTLVQCSPLWKVYKQEHGDG